MVVNGARKLKGERKKKARMEKEGRGGRAKKIRRRRVGGNGEKIIAGGISGESEERRINLEKAAVESGYSPSQSARKHYVCKRNLESRSRANDHVEEKSKKT